MASRSPSADDDEQVRYNLNPLLQSMTDIISDLSKPNGCLTKYEKNETDYAGIQDKLFRVKHIDNIERIESRYRYCHIQPPKPIKELTVAQRELLELDYQLFIHHQTDLYYATLTISRAQIQELHEIAVETKRYFPSTASTIFTFPKSM